MGGRDRIIFAGMSSSSIHPPIHLLLAVLLCVARPSAAQHPGSDAPLFFLPGFVHGVAAEPRGGAPYNDECANAAITPLSYLGSVTITGDNTGATDTEDFGNPNVWEAFTVDTCTTVVLEYCGTAPVFQVVYSIITIGCPGFESVQNNGLSFCDDGNARIRYENLAAGTYYVPVLLWPGQAEGPYTITLTSEPCNLPPANDRCVNATPVPVVTSCVNGLIIGSNSTTAIDSSPSCATSTSGFRDVWYRFNSGTEQSVTITVNPITMSDPGIEVRTACSGTLVFCGSLQTSYSFPVTPGTDHWLRIFSNNDIGPGGTFSLCVQGAAPPVCDGGTVSLAGATEPLVLCAVDAPVFLTQDAAGNVEDELVLTTEADTIVALLPGGELDPALYPPGIYRVYGVSYDGFASGLLPGAALFDAFALGTCFQWSETFLTVTVDICTALPDRADRTAPFRLANADDGLQLLWQAGDAPVDLELFGARGELIDRRRWNATQGARLQLGGPTGAVHPLFVRVQWPGGAAGERIVLVR